VVVRGPTRAAVASARTRLDIIIAAHPDIVPWTHFVSVPLNTPAAQKKLGSVSQKLSCTDAPLGEFIENASKIGSRGMDKSIFTRPAILHLTCFMVRLNPPEKVSAAVEKLREITPSLRAIASKLALRLEGLEIMNDDIHEVDVVYLKVTPPSFP